MTGQDHKPDEFDDVARRDDSPKPAGEFTSAFGAKVDRATESDPLTEGDLPAPGSLTQVLGGKSKGPLPAPDRLDQPRAVVPNAPESRPADSFTRAFEGVNAFTRNPADLGTYTIPAEPGRQPARPDANPSEPSGSFTRLFGSGEGILTPAGEEERPRPSAVRGPTPVAPSRPAEVESGGFTQAFQSQSAPESRELKPQRGSFTEEFGSPPTSWPAPEPLPSKSAPPYPSRPGSTLPGYNVDPVLPSTPQRSPAPAGGFTRLIDTLRPEPMSPEPAPPADVTRSSMRRAGPPEYPLADSDYAPGTSGAGPGATVVFNPSGPPEPELATPRGKSEYTMVVERSSLRPPAEVPGGGAPPYPAGAAAASPNPPQYPQMAAPVAPPWMPPPAPTPPWQPPQLTPPAMPQAPPLAPPAAPLQPPTLGNKLVSSLPFMLALTVINFLGLLAVLIILFATRK